MNSLKSYFIIYCCAFCILSLGELAAYEGSDNDLKVLLDDYAITKTALGNAKTACVRNDVLNDDCLSSTPSYLTLSKELSTKKLIAFKHYFDETVGFMLQSDRLTSAEKTDLALALNLFEGRYVAYTQTISLQEDLRALRSTASIMNNDMSTSLGLLRVLSAQINVTEITQNIGLTKGLSAQLSAQIKGAQSVGNNTVLAEKYYAEGVKSLAYADANYLAADKKLIGLTRSFRMVDVAREIQHLITEGHDAQSSALQSFQQSGEVLTRLYKIKPWKI